MFSRANKYYRTLCCCNTEKLIRHEKNDYINIACYSRFTKNLSKSYSTLATRNNFYFFYFVETYKIMKLRVEKKNLRRKCSTTFGMAIQFCDYNRTDINALFKSFRLCFASLTYCCIHYEDYIIWLLQRIKIWYWRLFIFLTLKYKNVI